MKLNIHLLSISIALFMTIAHVQSAEENNTNSTQLIAKTNEKTNYPKKVSNIKKKTLKTIALHQQATNSLVKLNKSNFKKKANSITEKFKDLPAEDLEFIKELDKQFNMHGGKVKIQIKNENVTDTKTSKRTIDGELGYGYNSNGYHYAPPKYEFYPYSQHDIPASAPQQPHNFYLPAAQQHKTQQLRTEVTIEPSYSYELKSHNYYEAQDQPQADLPVTHLRQQKPANDYDEPVIVLRIPGPTKYAAHLQSLLQKYLEIRAAQYLQILEANELRQQELQQQQQQQHYEHQQAAQKIQHQSAEQQYEQQEHEQQTVEEAPYYASPAASDADTYTEQEHRALQAQQEEQQQQTQELQYQQHSRQQEEQEHNQQQPEDAQRYVYYNAGGHMYETPIVQNKPHPLQVQYYYSTARENMHAHAPLVYLVQMPTQPQHLQYTVQPQMQPIYVEDDRQRQLSIVENNPRPTHTKIVYKSQSHAAADNTGSDYVLPTVRPYERLAPVINSGYNTFTHHITPAQEPQQIQQQHYAEQEVSPPPSSHSEVVITQRPPYYHGDKSSYKRGRRRNPNSAVQSSTTVRTTVSDTDEHLQKIRNYVREKYGAQTGSTVELSTKTVQKK